MYGRCGGQQRATSDDLRDAQVVAASRHEIERAASSIRDLDRVGVLIRVRGHDDADGPAWVAVNVTCELDYSEFRDAHRYCHESPLCLPRTIVMLERVRG